MWEAAVVASLLDDVQIFLGSPTKTKETPAPSRTLRNSTTHNERCSHAAFSLDGTQEGGFDPRAVHVGYVVGKMALVKVFTEHAIFWTKTHQNRNMNTTGTN